MNLVPSPAEVAAQQAASSSSGHGHGANAVPNITNSAWAAPQINPGSGFSWGSTDVPGPGAYGCPPQHFKSQSVNPQDVAAPFKSQAKKINYVDMRKRAPGPAYYKVPGTGDDSVVLKKSFHMNMKGGWV